MLPHQLRNGPVGRLRLGNIPEPLFLQVCLEILPEVPYPILPVCLCAQYELDGGLLGGKSRQGGTLVTMGVGGTAMTIRNAADKIGLPAIRPFLG